MTAAFDVHEGPHPDAETVLLSSGLGGAAGYWVDGGEIQFPVEEITIAGNLRDMFKGIVAVGGDVLMRSGRESGSILIDRMTIAGE